MKTPRWIPSPSFVSNDFLRACLNQVRQSDHGEPRTSNRSGWTAHRDGSPYHDIFFKQALRQLALALVGCSLALTLHGQTLPLLNAQLTATGDLRLSWPTPASHMWLFEAPRVTGPWNHSPAVIQIGEGISGTVIPISTPAKFYSLWRQFVDDFDDGDSSNWGFYYGQSCQSNIVTHTNASGVYRVEYQQESVQSVCGMFSPLGVVFSPFDLLEPETIFSDVEASVDIVDFEAEAYLSIAFRSEFATPGDPRVIDAAGYAAVVETFNDEAIRSSILFIRRAYGGGSQTLGFQEIPIMDKSRDYRMELTVVGNQFTLRLLELSDPPQLVDMLTVTDNALDRGAVAFVYSDGRSAPPNDLESGSIAIDNFRFSGSTP